MEDLPKTIPLSTQEELARLKTESYKEFQLIWGVLERLCEDRDIDLNALVRRLESKLD